MHQKPPYSLRTLLPGEEIPYRLLLLADETKEGIDRYIFESDIFVMEDGSRIIAVCVLQPICEDAMEIKNIAVDIPYQGRGFGHYLLSSAIQRAKESGCKEILIGTADVAVRQLALYEDAGFKRYALKRDFYIDNYPEPIYEDGVQLRDMVMLRQEL